MEARGEPTWCSDCRAVELWPENLPAVDLYLAVQTQWRYAGMDGQPTGYDYAGIRAAMALRGDPPELFADLQVLESAYLDIVTAQRAKAHATPHKSKP